MTLPAQNTHDSSQPRTSQSTSHTNAMLRTPSLKEGNPVTKREEIKHYFLNTFDTYSHIFGCLANDSAYFEKSIPLRHPLIFYLGHTATFFVNKLSLAQLLTERIDPQMESIFAVGVDEMSWDDLNDDHYHWPTVDEVFEYRAKVRLKVLELIESLPLTLPICWENPWWPILMGIEHERIHLETTSVLIRQHDLTQVKSLPEWQPIREAGQAPQNSMVDVPAGIVQLGKPFDDDYYSWDNEYGEHEAHVEAFQASQYLVSNQEFLEFVEDGGYSDNAFWCEEGISWKQFSNAQHPTFWRWHSGWYLRLMTEEVEMHWDWPVEVNCLEAKAFCQWKRVKTGQPIRMPSEDEWHRLCAAAGISEVNDLLSNANIHLDHGASPCSVTRFKHANWYDVVGNVWQWTETPIYPFENFKVHPLYDDFTTPTFDGRHNLIKGGSWISCGNESRLSARYAFRRHFFQHAGFRYISSNTDALKQTSYYESNRLLAEYAEFHFGENVFGVDNFPKAVAQIALAAMKNKPTRKALDLGCACGRSSFELAQQFDLVEGVDFSANFIRFGSEIATQGTVRYTLVEEGDLVSYRTRSLKELGLEHCAEKVSFYQGDACNLKPQFNGYDLVLAINLIDRLYQPSRFLNTIHERINAGGILIIASPYTWLEEHTPKEEWIGGFKKDGESYTTLDGLKALLGVHFKLVDAPRKVPFVIRETQHKHQHTLSELTVWERQPD